MSDNITILSNDMITPRGALTPKAQAIVAAAHARDSALANKAIPRLRSAVPVAHTSTVAKDDLMAVIDPSAHDAKLPAVDALLVTQTGLAGLRQHWPDFFDFVTAPHVLQAGYAGKILGINVFTDAHMPLGHRFAMYDMASYVLEL